jgi:AcrR family transcriptional regulator
MGIQERREREFRRRERDILDAALELFATTDWQSVTVEQIAERAEIGKGTVYKHFTTKDEIFANLVVDFKERALERLDAIDPSLPVLQRLRALIAVFWEQNRQAEEYHRLAQYCERQDFVQGLPGETRRRMAEQEARFQHHIDRVLTDGIEQGILPRKSKDALIFGPMSALQGAVRLMWGGCMQTEQRPGQYLEEITNFILAGMLYQEWLAGEGLSTDEATLRATSELREVEAELAETGDDGEA